MVVELMMRSCPSQSLYHEWQI